MSGRDTSIVDADSPLATRLVDQAQVLVGIGRDISVRMGRPGDTAECHGINALSQAIQASASAALNSGLEDGAVLSAVAHALGSLLSSMNVNNRPTLVALLANHVLAAGRDADRAAQFGFETWGTA